MSVLTMLAAVTVVGQCPSGYNPPIYYSPPVVYCEPYYSPPVVYCQPQYTYTAPRTIYQPQYTYTAPRTIYTAPRTTVYDYEDEERPQRSIQRDLQRIYVRETYTPQEKRHVPHCRGFTWTMMMKITFRLLAPCR